MRRRRDPRPMPTPEQMACLHEAEAAHRRIDGLEKQVRETTAYLDAELARNHFAEALVTAMRRLRET